MRAAKTRGGAEADECDANLKKISRGRKSLKVERISSEVSGREVLFRTRIST